jgi:hypothetical protein
VPIRIRRKVNGMGGELSEVYSATIGWNFEDNNGVPHPFVLPNSLFVPGATSRLLSPQHWAQVAKDSYPVPHGTWCGTFDDTIVQQWEQRRFMRTILLDVGETNVGTLYTTPGYARYEAFCAEGGIYDDDPDSDFVVFDCNLVSDDEPDDSQETEQWYDAESFQQRDSPLSMDFNLDGPPNTTTTNVIVDKEDVIPQDASAEFLRWHHRLGHISLKKIRTLAGMGVLPKRLLACKIPICTSCLYGKATRRPWRSKTPNNVDETVRTVTRSGDCVSVDQLESSTPGLVAQLKGRPTIKRYKAATIFLDHFSGLSYVHLQKSTSVDETIEAKDCFERYASFTIMQTTAGSLTTSSV